MGNRSDKEVSSKVESAIFAYSANKGFRAGSNQGARLQGRSTKRDVWLRQKLPFTYQSGNGDNWVGSSRDGDNRRHQRTEPSFQMTVANGAQNCIAATYWVNRSFLHKPMFHQTYRSAATAAPSANCARNSSLGGIGVMTSISTPAGSQVMK